MTSEQEDSHDRALAEETAWYVELSAKKGRAAGLDERVRSILLVVTLDAAVESARGVRAAESARLVDLARQERERQRLQAAEIRRAKEEHAVQERREQDQRRARGTERDKGFGAVWFWVSVTLLVPWLIGFYVLRDGVLLPRLTPSYEHEPRNYWHYFWALYFAGVGVLSMILAAILLLRSWYKRPVAVVAGIALALASVFGAFPWARSVWDGAESTTAQTLATSAFPFSKNFYSCGYGALAVLGSGGETEYWQVHTARIIGSDVKGCNRLVVFRGWDRIEQVDLEAGQVVTRRPEPNEGTTTADTVFTVSTVDGGSVQLALADFDSGWE